MAVELNVAAEHVEEALRFLNAVGDVMFFGDSAALSEGLTGLIFLDPQWLTNVLATVVTMRHNLGTRRGSPFNQS